MSKRDEFLAKLAKDVLECSVDGFDEDTTLDPWDSLAVISTISLIDEVYGKQVSGRALSACVKAGDVLRLVEA